MSDKEDQNESAAILNSYQKLWTEHLALRRERDALRAQNAESERQRLLLSKVNAETLAEHSTLRAERDALRAQLDGMIIETRRPGLGSGLPLVQKRLVGPWVEVE